MSFGKRNFRDSVTGPKPDAPGRSLAICIAAGVIVNLALILPAFFGTGNFSHGRANAASIHLAMAPVPKFNLAELNAPSQPLNTPGKKEGKEYTKDGKISSEKHRGPDGRDQTVRYEYDDDGKLKYKVTENPDGTESFTFSMQY